jgi:antitoxin ParD1/3/4
MGAWVFCAIDGLDARRVPMAYYAIAAIAPAAVWRKTPMPTRNVVLTKRQEKLIETLVGSGRYQNASEVLRDGLRLVEQRDAEDAAKLEALRQAARVGVAALERGEFKEFENIEDLKTYLNGLSEKIISDTVE